MPGPYGWAGAALLLAGLVCEAVAIFALMATAFADELSHAGPWFIVFLVSLPLLTAGWWLWRLGWKRSGIPPSSAENELRTPLLRATGVSILGSVLGFGAFLYLAFALRGSHRLAFAFSALLLGLAISDLGSIKLRRILQKRLPTRFGRSHKLAWVVFGLSLVSSVLLFLIGLLWPDLMPVP
jgi:hypothetical protein